ncbi:MAG: hypothetical protein ACI8RY_000437 [Urechidicola sp.]|jgi:hypothetical protein|tara:strand:- start:280 stop:750 length:471 start_codon:yes stop_codon:yes gene_type:complete
MNKSAYIYICLLAIFFKCSNNNSIDFNEIDRKIDCYSTATSIFSLICEDKNNSNLSNIFDATNKIISDLDYMSNQCLDQKNSIDGRKAILKTLNNYIDKVSKKCKLVYGRYDSNLINDSNYIYQMKINYITCLLDSTHTIDSIKMFCTLEGDSKLE